MTLALVLSLFLYFVSAVSPLEAPRTVEVEAGVLRWTPVGDDFTYSVESRRFLELSWSELAQCPRTALDRCDVAMVMREAELGCVGLRVRAQRGRESSEAVEACSVSRDTCTPQVNLSASPSSITVRLPRSHPLEKKYGRSANHWVCSWSLDQPKPKCTETYSSLSLPLTEQDAGRTYCVTVQYRLYVQKLVGLPHCPVCVEVPLVKFKHTAAILGTVLPLLALALGSGLAYVLIFHRKKVKKWLRPAPAPEFLSLSTEGAPVCTPTDGEYSRITGLIEIQQED